jgi:hypothetical protein
MEWESLEHSYTEKTNDWYASAIIIAGALIAVEFMINNFLLVTLTIIATITFLLMAARRPSMMRVQIRKNGIRVGDVLYPYQSLDGFSIIDYTPEKRLLLKSNKKLMPLIVVHIADDIDAEELHEDLSKYLHEIELHESAPQLFMEWIGF